MHTNKIMAALLMLCLLLTACTKTIDSASVNHNNEPSISESNAQANSIGNGEEDAILLPEPVVKEQSGVRISVEPAMELLAVIQYLSDYTDLGLITRYDITYKQDIDDYFVGMAGHDAISFINKYMTSGFDFDTPPTAALMINRDFTLDETAFAASIYAQSTNADINEFIEIMKAFYLDSNFETFYLDHTHYYNSILERTATSFPDWDMIAVMETYYGKKMESYNLVLSSMFHPGGYGPGIERKGGTAVYSVQGPVNEENGLPVFGSTESFSELVLHEFGHTFIPIYDATGEMSDILRARVDSAYLMEPIQEQMNANAYQEWNNVCEELVLRAVVIRMLVDNQKMDKVGLFRNEYDRGFIYIETAYESLQKYVENRETYPVFDDFIPILIDDLIQVHPAG